MRLAGITPLHCGLQQLKLVIILVYAGKHGSLMHAQTVDIDASFFFFSVLVTMQARIVFCRNEYSREDS